jgi:hypothetical protein
MTYTTAAREHVRSALYLVPPPVDALRAGLSPATFDAVMGFLDGDGVAGAISYLTDTECAILAPCLPDNPRHA